MLFIEMRSDNNNPHCFIIHGDLSNYNDLINIIDNKKQPTQNTRLD